MSAAASFPELPPPFAQALVRRGFTALTPIQTAVLDPALEGQDLRLASKTGSGKTLALGFVIARGMPPRPRPRTGRAAEPYALVIAPTRELAAQLQKELAWLFEPMAATIAVVAGGANYRDEFRALNSGPRVVVGTPGRLIDHLEKGSIDLSQFGVVVLDEADQMLDLGFRDELESILKLAPEERQTHMVSATFSRDIMSLAKKYQKDGKLIEGTALGEANEDIVHVAHRVRAHDRFDALVNLLLIAPEERALLFVRTRAAAAELAQRLTEVGFHTLALTGELAQRERNRTLEAFKQGTVRTLVATDVAARGLDIPDVSRVIHVDPPSEDEGFTHRSGRTGRAGKKGKSIVFVPPSIEYKVRSVLKRAGVQAEWQPLPDPEDILRLGDERLLDELAQGSAPDPRLVELAGRVLSTKSPETVVAALLERIGHGGPCAPRQVRSVEPRGGQRDNRSSDRDQDRGGRSGGKAPFKQGGKPSAHPADNKRGGKEDYVPFRVSYGSRDGADARRLLAMVCRRGHISGDQVGAIRIGEDHSTFEVRKEVAGDFGRATNRPDPKNPKARIHPITDGGEQGDSHARPRGDNSAKPRSKGPRHQGGGGYGAPRRKKGGSGRSAPR